MDGYGEVATWHLKQFQVLFFIICNHHLYIPDTIEMSKIIKDL